MLQTMEQSSDTAIGYTVIGEVGKADYQTLVPAVQAAIDKNGSINLLLDLTQFKWEKVEAWKSDLEALENILKDTPASCTLDAVVAKYLINEKSEDG